MDFAIYVRSSINSGWWWVYLARISGSSENVVSKVLNCRILSFRMLHNFPCSLPNNLLARFGMNSHLLLISLAGWPEFRPKKAQKGLGKKLAEFYQKWQKRNNRKFSKEVLYFTVTTNTQRRKQYSLFHFELWLRLNFALRCEIGQTFPKIGRIFFNVLGEKQF